MNSRQFIVWWNNAFPFDKAYRRKYGIGLNSPEHRALDPISIKLESLEDLLFNEYRESAKLKEFESSQMDKGEWLKYREPLTEEESSDLFDKMIFGSDINPSQSNDS